MNEPHNQPTRIRWSSSNEVVSLARIRDRSATCWRRASATCGSLMRSAEIAFRVICSCVGYNRYGGIGYFELASPASVTMNQATGQIYEKLSACQRVNQMVTFCKWIDGDGCPLVGRVVELTPTQVRIAWSVRLAIPMRSWLYLWNPSSRATLNTLSDSRLFAMHVPVANEKKGQNDAVPTCYCQIR